MPPREGITISVVSSTRLFAKMSYGCILRPALRIHTDRNSRYAGSFEPALIFNENPNFGKATINCVSIRQVFAASPWDPKSKIKEQHFLLAGEGEKVFKTDPVAFPQLGTAIRLMTSGFWRGPPG